MVYLVCNIFIPLFEASLTIVVLVRRGDKAFKADNCNDPEATNGNKWPISRPAAISSTHSLHPALTITTLKREKNDIKPQL